MTNAGPSPNSRPAPEPGRTTPRPASGPAKPGTAQHAKISGPLTGRRIGPYRVTDQIGKGGMGVVYRAHDTALDRTVAIKILPPHLSGDEEFVKRFVREARSAARLDHPCIVQVFQAGRMVSEGAAGPGPCFIAMQYFDGRPLSDLIASEGRLEPLRALNIARQVAEALAAAHAAGIVHRDIKSSNILVGEGDKVKVTDFGLATCVASEGKRITQTGAYLGTPEYSSPEQCEGTELDGRSDMYSLGVVLYEMLTGKVPFEAATPLKLFDRIVHEAPEPLSRVQPGLPRELSSLVGKMLAKSRDERFSTAEELLSAMRRVRVALGSWKRGPGTGLRRPVRLQGRWPRLAAAAGSVLLLAAVGGLIFHLSRSGREQPQVEPVVQPVLPAPQSPKGTIVGPAIPPETSDLGVVIFDLASRVDAREEKQLSWVRAGVPDMLITELKQCSGLTVFSRERAADALRATGGQDLTAAARRLGARLMVSGSLYSAGGRLRIDLCVADASTGKVAEAVKDEGTEAQIFDLVSSLGRKLRASFDSLMAERRGQGRPLAAAPVRSAEEVFFLAMADPDKGNSGPGGGGGLPVAKARSAGATGTDRAAAGRALVEGGVEGRGSLEAAQARAKEAESLGSPDAVGGADGKQAPGPYFAAAEAQKLREGEAAKRKAETDKADFEKSLKDRAAEPGAPTAAMPPPPAKASAAPVAGGLAWARDLGQGEMKSGKAQNAANKSEGAAKAEAPGEASRERGGQRADRVEAMRHYYTGIRLLDQAGTNKEFSEALAELVLAKSLAPNLAIADEAIRRANQGLDEITRE